MTIPAAVKKCMETTGASSFHLGNFQHVGAFAGVQRHGCYVDYKVARFETTCLFQNLHHIVDGIIGGGKAVVIMALHAPNEVQGSKHVHPIGKDMNLALGPLA